MIEADIKRITLGTVQFGMNYGIRNFSGQVPTGEVEAILKIARSAGIRTLDTARAYGAAESVLGELLPGVGSGFSVISKIPPGILPGTISRHLDTSLAMLKRPCLDGYLFHDVATYKNYPWSWQEIEHELDSGRIKKAGFSVYFPEEAEFLLDNGPDFGMIQFPYNVLDQRFFPLMQRFADRGIEMFARSVFLQGSLFFNSDDLPAFMEPSKPSIQILEKIEKETSLTREAILLNFVLNSHPDLQPVIGVDSAAQLNAILKSLENKEWVGGFMTTLKELGTSNESIILPYKWDKE